MVNHSDHIDQNPPDVFLRSSVFTFELFVRLQRGYSEAMLTVHG